MTLLEPILAQGSGGSGLSDLLLNQPLIGTKNGVNTIFTVANNIDGNNIQVFRDGVGLFPGQGLTKSDTNEVTLNDAPDSDEDLIANYVQSS